jgi:O-antigen ligase
VWITITNQDAVLNGARNWLFTYLQLLLFLLLTNLLYDQSKFNKFRNTYLTATIASSIYGIYHFLESGQDYLRTAGFAGNPNEYAMYILVGLILLLSLIFENTANRNFYSRLGLIFGAMLIIVGIVLSGSRTGLISLLVLFVVLFILFGKRLKSRRLSFLLIIFLIAVIFVLGSNYSEQFIRQYTEDIENLFGGLTATGTMGNRYRYWWAAFQMWKTSPLIGIGYDQFRFLYNDFRIFFDRNRITPPHNVFVGLLAETGIIGLGLFISWLVSTSRGLINQVKTSSYTEFSYRSFFWLTNFIIIMVFCFTGNFEYSKLLWVVSGVSVASIAKSNLPSAKDRI